MTKVKIGQLASRRGQGKKFSYCLSLPKFSFSKKTFETTVRRLRDELAQRRRAAEERAPQRKNLLCVSATLREKSDLLLSVVNIVLIMKNIGTG